MKQPPARFAALVVGIMVAGCSLQRPSHLARPDKSSVVTVDPAEIAAATDAPEPEILPSTYLAAGKLFQSNRQFAKAMAQYRKAIAAEPNYVEAHHLLGVVAGYLGRHGEAEAALRRAIQLSPGSSDVRNNLGFEYIMQRKWAEAAREFQRAVTIDPGFDRAYINLGLALAAQGRFEEAFTKFRWVLPEPDAYYNLGLTYLANRRYDEARNAFDRALASDPRFEAARRQLERLPGPGGDEAAPTAGVVPAAFVPEESFIGTVTQADWTGIRNTLGDASAAERPADRQAGDFDGDGDIDQADGVEFNSCFFSLTRTMSWECGPGDFDDDGDVDLLDYFQFQAVFAQARPEPSSPLAGQ